MARKLRFAGVILGALSAALVMTLLLMATLRYPVFSRVVFGLYLLLPIAILIWSILSHIKRRNTLFLTFGISLLVSTVLSFGLFVVMLIMALRSFT